MKRRDSKYNIYKGEIDIDKISNGLRVSPEECLRQLSDGRCVAPWSEIWAVRVFGLNRAKTDNKFSDASGSRDSNYSVKTLTSNGTAVRLSSHTGVSRTCDSGKVKEALKSCVGYIFVDNTNLPSVSLIQIPSSILMDWHNSNIISLKDGSISYKKFYDNFYNLGEIEVINVDLSSGGTLNDQ